jgi:hypothetical protein
LKRTAVIEGRVSIITHLAFTPPTQLIASAALQQLYGHSCRFLAMLTKWAPNLGPVAQWDSRPSLQQTSVQFQSDQDGRSMEASRPKSLEALRCENPGECLSGRPCRPLFPGQPCLKKYRRSLRPGFGNHARYHLYDAVPSTFTGHTCK